MMKNINYIKKIQTDCMHDMIECKDFWQFVASTYRDFDLSEDALVTSIGTKVLESWQTQINIIKQKAQGKSGNITEITEDTPDQSPAKNISTQKVYEMPAFTSDL
jgi:hypothetical protein